jgi:hypothetical protein
MVSGKATVKQDKFEGYDIIGDIHGCGSTLIKLLEVMGYRKWDGVYQHPRRQAIFVGDIVDRGPNIRQALRVVHDMVTNGHGQMVIGNHEYNIYCYATRDPRTDPNTIAYLRTHNKHNERLVAETFDQFVDYPEEFNRYLEWFSQLPLFLDLPNFRVVHACWDEHYIHEYQQRFGHNRVSPEIILASTKFDSFEGRVLDRLMRGTSLALPGGEAIVSRDGFRRRFFRTKFWSENPETYSDVVFQPDPLPEHLADHKLSVEERRHLIHYPPHAKPVFIGHYWLQGKPAPVKHNICCLDYSAVKYGRLVAYRMDVDDEGLDKDNYVWLYVDPPEHM